MKKRVLATMLILAMTFSLAGCSGGSKDSASGSKDSDKKTESKAEDAPESTKIRWNCGNSGDVLLTIAKQKGYLEDEGIEVETVRSTNADAMTMLSTGQVDVVSNSGTSNPLQQIASGVDFTVFGGHMVTGCMPIIAKKGTEWKGVESLVGKKFACNPSYFAFSGALMDKGYNDPLNQVEWLTYSSYDDALAAVVRGEADYALMGTGQNYNVKNMDDIEIVAYQSDVMPNYSCCRLVCQTDYLKKNPNTLKHLMKAMIRAQEFYESNLDEAVSMQAKEIDADEDYVAAYMLDKEHYVVSIDPLKNSVERAWDILDKIGFLDEKAKDINIDDHINTELYEQALTETTEKYGKDDPDFYDKMKTFYDENNK